MTFKAKLLCFALIFLGYVVGFNAATTFDRPDTESFTVSKALD